MRKRGLAGDTALNKELKAEFVKTRCSRGVYCCWTVSL